MLLLQNERMFVQTCITDSLRFKQRFNGFQWAIFGLYGAECYFLIYTVCVIHILQNGITFFTCIQTVTILPNFIPFALKQPKWSKKLNCKRPKNVPNAA